MRRSSGSRAMCGPPSGPRSSAASAASAASSPSTRAGRRSRCWCPPPTGWGRNRRSPAGVGRYDTIGIDCVAMSVDDLAVCGAEPLFFLDYISVGRNDPAVIEALVSGVAEAAGRRDVPWSAARSPSTPASWSRATSTSSASPWGWSRRTRRLPRGSGPATPWSGSPAPGCGRNGYSLARKVLVEPRRPAAATNRPGRGPTSRLGEELLRPSVIYSPALRPSGRRRRGARLRPCHRRRDPRQPGRVLPDGLGAEIRRGSWPEPPIFAEVAEAGGVADEEMDAGLQPRARHAGRGARRGGGAAIASLAAAGHAAYEVGRIVDGAGVAVHRG